MASSTKKIKGFPVTSRDSKHNNARKKTSFTTPNKCHLTKAPKKATYNGSVGKNRRRLFTDSPEEKLSSDVQLILPSVLNNLNKGGYKEDFCLLLKGIASGKFPIHNIAFRLLLDIAKWYSLDNTTQMQYSSESMKFWKVVYRLFHGKALRFLSGEKSIGQVIDGSSSKGLHDPQKSKINFAVPNINSINNFQSVNINIPKEIFPGIITEAFKFLPRGKSYELSVDGKKIAPGLNSKHGDQDLFGHEDRNSLQSLQKRLDTEIQKVESLINEWITMTNNDRKEKLFEIVRIVSLRIKDLRELFQNQNFALKKFYKEAGEDWRTSRYVYAISSIQALMFQIKSVLKRLLETNNMIFNEITILCQSSKSFLRGTNTDMYSQDNWVSLKEPEDLPGSIGDDLRFVKQRSPLWFENRNGFRLTGSKIFEGLGLDSLKNLQKHHDKVIRKKDVQENISEIVQERMDHGTKSEIHAIATLTSKVLPVYYPDMKYFEEGAFHIKHDGKPFILVSPDGSIGQLEVGTAHEQTVPVLSCEFKCPFPNENTIPVHYTIPTR
ncbi:Hypothetical predicted protein [Mytilus galloprovincialis]|uniref:Uncharacterized protein n=2 Tax=Mytilus galloprovincialis TaxID=29158 RepID=A0A8B6FCT8_MYTGA|nr:Hypothetical predicted protein [Mytilus galloprovincialis]